MRAGELGHVEIPLDARGPHRRHRLRRHDECRGEERAIRVLKPYLKPGHQAIGSINSPMQCMMKEICAQCLQMHQDPATGEERVVFSCANQDQPLDRVDFAIFGRASRRTARRRS